MLSKQNFVIIIIMQIVFALLLFSIIIHICYYLY